MNGVENCCFFDPKKPSQLLSRRFHCQTSLPATLCWACNCAVMTSLKWKKKIPIWNINSILKTRSIQGSEHSAPFNKRQISADETIPLNFIFNTLFEKSNFCPKIQFSRDFHPIFLDIFSREIKVVNS